MTERTQEWAERVGREAVELGMPCYRGIIYFDDIGRRHLMAKGVKYWSSGHGPDFRDRLTEKACELWVEDVARDVYGDTVQVDFKFGPAGPYEQRVAYCRVIGDCVHPRVVFTCLTLSEACIAAVRAMKGGE